MEKKEGKKERRESDFHFAFSFDQASALEVWTYFRALTLRFFPFYHIVIAVEKRVLRRGSACAFALCSKGVDGRRWCQHEPSLVQFTLEDARIIKVFRGGGRLQTCKCQREASRTATARNDMLSTYWGTIDSSEKEKKKSVPKYILYICHLLVGARCHRPMGCCPQSSLGCWTRLLYQRRWCQAGARAQD